METKKIDLSWYSAPVNHPLQKASLDGFLSSKPTQYVSYTPVRREARQDTGMQPSQKNCKPKPISNDSYIFSQKRQIEARPGPAERRDGWTEREVVREDSPVRTVHKQSFWVVRYAVVAAILIITTVLAIDTLETNHQVRAEVTKVPGSSYPQENTSPAAVTQSSTDTPSETPIKPDVKRNYFVAPGLPKLLSIEKIGLEARVLQMGVLANGELATPANTSDTGWYTGSVKPGEMGAVLIDGHYSGRASGGVFHNLHKLQAGDRITLAVGGEKQYVYEVRKTQQVPADQVDMKALLSPYTGAERGMNLITCGGKYNRESKTFVDRTIVYAVQM